MAHTQSFEPTATLDPEVLAEVAGNERSGLSPKTIRRTLLVINGLMVGIAGFGVGMALAQSDMTSVAIFGAALVIWASAFGGVAADKKWGYVVTLVIGVLVLVQGFTSTGSSLGVGVGAAMASLTSIRLFHPAHR